MHTIKQRSKNAMHWDSPCSFYHFQQRRGKATEDAVMVAEGQQPISEFWFNLNVLRCFFFVCVLFVLDNHHMITTFFFFSILYQYWISTTRVVGQFSEQLILDLYCKICFPQKATAGVLLIFSINNLFPMNFMRLNHILSDLSHIQCIREWLGLTVISMSRACLIFLWYEQQFLC